MPDITDIAKLSFFKVGKYEHSTNFVYDFRDCPRPHYCMGLIYKGTGSFRFDSECVKVTRGDIIFVPVGTTYISDWTGSPDILYISMHFSVELPYLFPRNRIYKIQKVRIENPQDYFDKFLYAFENYNGDEVGKLAVYSIFCDVMSKVVPLLKYSELKEIDDRIEFTLNYIEQNCTKDLSVDSLAKQCGLSVSHFYSRFKAVVGMSPLEYKHKVCTNKAILLLIDGKMNVEEISVELGFYSSDYFRRVFKKVTGMTPSEYKKNGIE